MSIGIFFFCIYPYSWVKPVVQRLLIISAIETASTQTPTTLIDTPASIAVYYLCMGASKEIFPQTVIWEEI